MSLLDRGIRGNIPSPLTGSDASTIGYSNPRIPTSFNGNISSVLDYLTDALYPDYKGTVATPADLPVSASANDFYLVNDDGDGKSAGYVWTVIGGSGSWVKRYDVDWSYEGILAEATNRTQYMYVQKYGISDRDATGTPISGTYAGQRIYGGDATNESLTLTSNSGDWTTGFVQCDNFFRPTSTNTLDLGTNSHRWRTLYLGTSASIGTTTLAPGSLSDSGGSFSFGSNDVVTTGTLTGASLNSGTLSASTGSITDSSGSISFGSTALTTTGTVTGASGSTLADVTVTNGTFNTSSTSFNFSNKNLAGIGSLTLSTVVATEIDVGNLILSGQTLTSNADATDLILQAGTGSNATQVQVNSKLRTNFDLSVSGLLTVSGNSSHTLAGSVTVGSAAKISNNSSNAKFESTVGDVQLVASSGQVISFGNLAPSTANTKDLGATGSTWKDFYLAGNVSNGTSSIAMSTLLLFSSAVGTVTGQGIFWDGSKWIAHDPSTEVTHSSILGLTTGDAGHTQFALLAGRSGGQTIQGGTAAADSLVLESTSNASKGKIFAKDELAPYSDAVYSSGWSGVSLGDASHNYNNIYSKGVHYGLRLEAYAGSGAYPASSGQNIGRTIFDSTLSKIVVDTGSAWVNVGASEKYSSDTSWDGIITTLTVTVSASITDARTAIWQLCDNTNDYERIFCSIKAISSTQVKITVSPPLPSGSYRLIGLN